MPQISLLQTEGPALSQGNRGLDCEAGSCWSDPRHSVYGSDGIQEGVRLL